MMSRGETMSPAMVPVDRMSTLSWADTRPVTMPTTTTALAVISPFDHDRFAEVEGRSVSRGSHDANLRRGCRGHPRRVNVGFGLWGWRDPLVSFPHSPC